MRGHQRDPHTNLHGEHGAIHQHAVKATRDQYAIR